VRFERHPGGCIAGLEFNEEDVPRRVELSHAIDVDMVVVKLNKGILRVTAGKDAPEGKKIEAEAYPGFDKIRPDV
jgi:HSP20 family molecular chaperone IbpA